MVRIDGLTVEDEDEAQKLMFHHLELAAQYFEVTPRILTYPKTFSLPAMKAWVRDMNALYPGENQ